MPDLRTRPSRPISRADGEGFVIMMVCSHNTALSPLAEQLLRKALSASGAASSVERADLVSLMSRGTRALVDEPMKDWAAQFSRRLGGEPAGHVARQVRVPELQNADLVVTLAEAQRATVARMLPAVAKRIVTLKELAGLAEQHAASTLDYSSVHHGAADLLARRVRSTNLRSDQLLSVSEPSWAAPATDHARCATEIDTAATAIGAWLSAITRPEPRHPTHMHSV